jgi:hypothetical protein
MSSIRFSELPDLPGSIDPSDTSLLYDDSRPPTDKSVALPISALLELSTAEPTIGGALVLSSNLNLTLNDPDYLSIDPGGSNRILFLPEPNPSFLKVFGVFNVDVNYEIEVFIIGSNTRLAILGGSSAISHFRAYSIEDDWYLIRGVDS